MKLHFHGGEYDYRPCSGVEIREGNVGGRYRGSPWKIHQYKFKKRQQKLNQERIYRGVRYVVD
jgi:hypothetical protein